VTYAPRCFLAVCSEAYRAFFQFWGCGFCGVTAAKQPEWGYMWLHDQLLAILCSIEMQSAVHLTCRSLLGCLLGPLTRLQQVAATNPSVTATLVTHVDQPCSAVQAPLLALRMLASLTTPVAVQLHISLPRGKHGSASCGVGGLAVCFWRMRVSTTSVAKAPQQYSHTILTHIL
jgi:hypothetical protein